jgi:hypothetical protein
MTATPALDFLRKVQVWQEDEANKTAGLVVVMPAREETTLAGILADQARGWDWRTLEPRARPAGPGHLGSRRERRWSAATGNVHHRMPANRRFRPRTGDRT